MAKKRTPAPVFGTNDAERKAYPMTVSLIDTANGILEADRRRSIESGKSVHTVARSQMKAVMCQCIETFKEYEHGTADACDIHGGLTLEALCDVYQDLILSTAN